VENEQSRAHCTSPLLIDRVDKKSEKTISAETIFAEWRKDAAYLEEFRALEDEFALARLFISARGAAGMTQAELARKMETSQLYIARLESGRERPSTRTLNRLAAATGHKVVIRFEPVEG
jgi:ribosome-binding protein aMBF1 (putative translation factor)